jgi:dTDP-4-amino-4,6-dideoxygalactose transaminase
MIPFIRPNPPKLSELSDELLKLEQSGMFSNFGPQNSLFEKRVVEEFFGGEGYALTVCNATIGLMLALKEATAGKTEKQKYVLIPSFTFAATAQAAIWCGFVPILYDIDAKSWLPCKQDEKRLLDKYRNEVAAVIPYATFGNLLDLDHYQAIAEHYGVSIVVDAAASLGTRRDESGLGFGSGSPIASVFSMHVTKTFSTSEAGLIYSADQQRIQRLRQMSNFGFDQPRDAGMIGLNAKLSEIGALLALAKLSHLDAVVEKRIELHELYERELSHLQFQSQNSRVMAHQFMACLIPPHLTVKRDAIVEGLTERGIGAAKYFSPHLADQRYFKSACIVEQLPVTKDISSRILSLPLFDTMSREEVSQVCSSVIDLIN